MDNLFAKMFRFSAICVGIAIVISSLECIWVLLRFGPCVPAWKDANRQGRIRGDAILSKAFNLPVNVYVLGVRVLCGLVFMFAAVWFGRALCICALIGLFSCTLVIRKKFSYQVVGADDMATIVIVGLLIAIFRISSSWRFLGLSFIAAESCLSYFASGAGKVFSPVWRNGSALHKIFNTGTVGNRFIAKVLRGNEAIGLAGAWMVIGFELLFPLALVVPVKVMACILGIGILFHLFNAFIMGLNTFLWSFTATYPAIWYCHVQLVRWF